MSILIQAEAIKFCAEEIWSPFKLLNWLKILIDLRRQARCGCTWYEMEAEVLDVHCFLSPDLDADDVVVWTALAPNKRVISQLTFH